MWSGKRGKVKLVPPGGEVNVDVTLRVSDPAPKSASVYLKIEGCRTGIQELTIRGRGTKLGSLVLGTRHVSSAGAEVAVFYLDYESDAEPAHINLVVPAGIRAEIGDWQLLELRRPIDKRPARWGATARIELDEDAPSAGGRSGWREVRLELGAEGGAVLYVDAQAR